MILQEAKDCVCERLHASTMAVFVSAVFEAACLEKKAKEQPLAGELLAGLFAERLLTPAALKAGLMIIFEIVPDLIVDVPMLWDCVARVIGNKPRQNVKHIL